MTLGVLGQELMVMMMESLAVVEGVLKVYHSIPTLDLEGSADMGYKQDDVERETRQ